MKAIKNSLTSEQAKLFAGFGLATKIADVPSELHPAENQALVIAVNCPVVVDGGTTVYYSKFLIHKSKFEQSRNTGLSFAKKNKAEGNIHLMTISGEFDESVMEAGMILDKVAYRIIETTERPFGYDAWKPYQDVVKDENGKTSIKPTTCGGLPIYRNEEIFDLENESIPVPAFHVLCVRDEVATVTQTTLLTKS